MLEGKGVRQSMRPEGQLLGQCRDGELLRLAQTELLYLQDFDSLEHFKAELIDYLCYYNNRRIKRLEAKGPDTCSTQIPDPFRSLNYIFCLTLGALHFQHAPFPVFNQ
ncbi:MAG: IS3 family transposase [Ruthenibacterium lactatiformans]